MTTPPVRVHGLVTGRVQGVCYRQACQEVALAHGVSGWVRNLDDGRVEVVLQGERAAVEAVIGWCWIGPPEARVHSVEVHEEPTGPTRGFVVR